MEKIDSDTIQEMFKFYEAILNLEIKETQQQLNNIKRINLKNFTGQILAEMEVGLAMSREDILYRIKQITVD